MESVPNLARQNLSIAFRPVKMIPSRRAGEIVRIKKSLDMGYCGRASCFDHDLEPIPIPLI
jgi:hypothetical protein